MGKKLLVFIIVNISITSISTTSAQQVLLDSLNSALEVTESVFNKAEILLEIANTFQQTNPDTLIEISKLAEEIALEIGSDSLLIQSRLLTASGLLRSGSYTSSISMFENVRDYIAELGTDEFELQKAHALQGIGNIYFIQFEQELALEYYLDVMPIYEALGEKHSLARLHNNIASVHLEMERTDEAEKNYLISLQYYEEIADIMGIASTNVNLALLYSLTERLDEATEFAQKTLETAKEQNALVMESYAVRILGSVAYDQKNLEAALNYNLRSAEIADELEIIYEQKDSYKNLADIYYELGQFKLAYDSYLQHKVYNDTLNNRESRNRLAEMRAEYETEQQAQEILLLEKENEAKSARIISISLSLSSVLIVVVVLSIAFANRKRKEIEILEKNKIIADSKKKLAEEELANAQLREENLQKELTNYALHIVEKNDFLEEVKSEMIELRTEVKNREAIKQINKLGSKIYHNLMINKDREEFEIQVEQACVGFFKSMEQKYPSLTKQEHRLAALLRLNLSSKEISGILNISPKSVDQSRYRLRKKLELPKTENLGVFLNQL